MCGFLEIEVHAFFCLGNKLTYSWGQFNYLVPQRKKQKLRFTCSRFSSNHCQIDSFNNTGILFKIVVLRQNTFLVLSFLAYIMYLRVQLFFFVFLSQNSISIKKATCYFIAFPFDFHLSVIHSTFVVIKSTLQTKTGYDFKNTLVPSGYFGFRSIQLQLM